jgi:hypothetical protein
VPLPRPRPITWLFVVAIGLAAAPLLHLPQVERGKRIALWGDSMAWEAQDSFRHAIQTAGDTSVLTRTYGGTAPCDWLVDIRRQARRWHPAVAVLAFSGNTGSACMRGRDPEAAYRADITDAVRLLTSRDTRVVLVDAPPRRDQPVDAAGLTSLDRLWRQVAVSERLTTVATAARAVTEDGRWTTTLPCARDERCPTTGAVTVRSPDGVHFCPRQEPAMTRCPIPSPGATRYGRAMATAALAVPT